MIYLDSSVALAYLLAEAKAPGGDFFKAALISSRLLQYEVWVRVHARHAGAVLVERTRALLVGIELLDMNDVVLIRTLQPLPVAVRTLDALHLATMDFIRRQGESVELASYDSRLLQAAASLGFATAAL